MTHLTKTRRGLKSKYNIPEAAKQIREIYLFEVIQRVLALLAHFRDEGDAGD